MNTINKKTHLYKWLIAAALTFTILGAAKTAHADTYWNRSGDTLSPVNSGDNIDDVNNITARSTGTAAAGKFKTTVCTASGTKAVAFGNNTQATGNYAAAFGSGSIASGAQSVAFGASKARGSAGFATGYTDDPNLIDANGPGSIAMGYATDSGLIRSWNNGSLAMGYAVNDGDIYSVGKGSLAGGDANNGGWITASGDGSIALGWNNSGATQATGQGSIAMGYNNDANLFSTAKGSVAMGYVTHPYTLEASGDGSIAMGYANNGDTEALHNGSVAIGNGVVADNNNAFALGTGFTNSTADSFAVGFGQKDLEVWDANAKVNGNLEITELKSNETKTMFFAFDHGTNFGDYRTKTVSASGEFRFDFSVPSDYVSLVSLNLVGVISAGAAGDGKNIDFTSDYGAIGETPTNHSESDTTSTYPLSGTSGEWYGFDISGLFDSLAAGDNGGIDVKHNAIGGNIDYIGVILKYRNR